VEAQDYFLFRISQNRNAFISFDRSSNHFPQTASLY